MNLSESIRTDSAAGRRYTYPGKARGYPSVTTVIGKSWPSPYLENWRINNVAKQVVGHSVELAEKLKHISQKPPKIRDLHAKGLGERFIGWKDDYTAADRGTRIHSGLEDLLLGEKSEKKLRKTMKPDEYAAVVSAKDALERLQVTPLFVEAPVFCHDPCYAGTVDLIGTYPRILRGKKRQLLAVIDLKTGRRLSSSYGPQLAAYAKATELLTADGLIPMPPVKVALVLHATPKIGKFYRVDLEEAWQDFLACAHLYAASNRTGGLQEYE